MKLSDYRSAIYKGIDPYKKTSLQLPVVSERIVSEKRVNSERIVSGKRAKKRGYTGYFTSDFIIECNLLRVSPQVLQGWGVVELRNKRMK